ncbi:MAG: cAMP/cGMP-dependent 3',5'-cyclic-AMP/GMP phosphodiesterase [Spirochaetales bacterium]|nr:cAMP/cGMP-dependent 3',5'-cyclic-AMP/GMP phosphodiesterase [Spirochaetales bacterium]
MKPIKKLKSKLTELPRGGYLVDTPQGYIQFGSPPETIKDTMDLPDSVPQIFVLPKHLFSWDKGISLAELEFPIYYNFFFKKRKTHIICSREQGSNLQKVLQEAIFGPIELNLDDDFPPYSNVNDRPDLRAEMDFFRTFSFEDLLSLNYFENNRFIKDDLVIEIDKKEDFLVKYKKKSIAKVPGEIKYTSAIIIGQRLAEPYKPPLFGITCLGPSHGFDPTQNTSGFIIWLNHSGIMIDPPVNSTEWLESSNVNPKLINSIILTHCHADHDAGTFQKILEEGRITIYTTHSIMNSFLRKYASLSHEPLEYLKQLFNFQPVHIGKPVFIHGARFTMSYMLHSIPTMGFNVEFQNQSFVYSSDHQNNPEIHKELLGKKIISKTRFDELSAFPWNSDLIYHESGVPPLHTPIKFLNSLDKNIQNKTIVYHIAKKDFPEKTNLRLAQFGIENTIYLKTKPPKFEKTYQILGVLKHLDFFKAFSIDKVQDFIMFVEEEKFKKGETIIKKGTRGDKFYIIASGNVAVPYEKHKQKKIYGIYEYFGEVALLTNQTRMVNLIAETDVTAYTISKDHFLSFIAGTEFEETLRNLINNRDRETWEIFSSSPTFSRLTNYQKTWLESVLHPVKIRGKGILIEENEFFSNVFIIRKGKVLVSKAGKDITVLKRGDLAGATLKWEKNIPAKYTFYHKSSVLLYAIKRRDYEKFIEKNPGLLMKFAYSFETN